jgi:hypothetical protein
MVRYHLISALGSGLEILMLSSGTFEKGTQEGLNVSKPEKGYEAFKHVRKAVVKGTFWPFSFDKLFDI